LQAKCDEEGRQKMAYAHGGKAFASEYERWYGGLYTARPGCRSCVRDSTSVPASERFEGASA
jgi:hypothetical protein